MSAAPSRSTRDRPAKTPLSRDAVVDAALGVLQGEGLDAVTMRRVAAELDTGAASLYVYVANRSELLDLMLDRVAAAIPREEIDPARWREQVTRLLTAEVETMDAHPGIARIAVARIPSGDGSLGVAETLIALLRAGGVPDASAAWAADVLHLFTTAAAFENSIQAAEGRDGREMEEYVADIQARFTALSPERYPNIVGLLPFLFAGTVEERFAFGLDVMINGLLVTPPPTPGPVPE